MRIWRNWQTRMVQVHVRAISWRFKSSYPHHVGTDFAPFRFLFAQKSVTCAVVPPLSQKGALSHLLFREKARSASLFACKRAHDDLLSLPPFGDNSTLRVLKTLDFTAFLRKFNKNTRRIFIKIKVSLSLPFLIFYITKQLSASKQYGITVFRRTEF